MMDWSDMTALLDEVIAKGEQAEGDLRKALSFNPMVAIDMSSGAPYHNPYRTMEDGSFAPHNVDDLMAMHGLRGEIARDGYREVELFLNTGRVTKALLHLEVDELLKADFRSGLDHHEKIKLVRHHLKRRTAEEKKQRQKELDKRIKEHVDGAFKEYHQNEKIKKRVSEQMQKRAARAASRGKKKTKDWANPSFD